MDQDTGVNLSGIYTMHDLHIWTITSGVNALSVHVIMKDETNFAEIGDLVRNIKEHLASEFNITHTTIEVHEGNKNYLQNIV